MRGSVDVPIASLAAFLALASIASGAWATTANSFGGNDLQGLHRIVSVFALLAAGAVMIRLPSARALIGAGVAGCFLAGGLLEARQGGGVAGLVHAVAASVLFTGCMRGVLLATPAADMNFVIDSGSPSLRILAKLTWYALLMQTALGALYRHNLVGLMPHVACALLVMGLVMYAGIAAWSTENAPKPVTRTAMVLLVATGCQMLFGIAAYLYRAEAQPAAPMLLWSVIHVAVGAMTTATCALMEIQISRYVRPAVVAL
ncbi:MAG: hypothetical protein FJW30_17090 [Acidobacteria bacterium]|nr:hypothetical protein [Acidobacteriota bacterium]